MTITNIAIKNLIHSPRNVRKSQPSKAADKELLSTIRAKGLIQNLTVIPAKKTGQFEVIAGGRRLAAIKALVEEKHLKPSDVVPCKILTDASSAEEIATIENVQREKMHPADEFEAFQKMADNGLSTSAIAADMGISQHYVKQRLKLAAVAPEIIADYRKEKIDLQCIMAFTLSDDQEQQRAVYKTLQESQGNYISTWNIKKALQKNAISSNSTTAKFVGKAAYKKAGGSIVADMFSDEEHWNDSDILNQLAIEKLTKAAKPLKDKWNWIEIAVENPDLNLPQIDKHSTKESKKLAAQRKKVMEEFDTLDRQEGELTKDQEKQLQRLDKQHDKLNEQINAAEFFTPGEMVFAGCVVTIDYYGTLHIDEGLVRKSDAGALRKFQQGDDSGISDTNQPEESESTHLSNTLRENLTDERTTIAKAHLVNSPDIARDTLYFTLCMSELKPHYHQKPADIRAGTTRGGDGSESDPQGLAAQALHDARGALPLDWMRTEDAAEQFEHFCALSQDKKDQIMAFCVATTLHGTLSDTGSAPILEHIYQKLNIDWAMFWRPTVKNYLGRINKTLLISHGKKLLGDVWAKDAEKGRKTKDIALELEGTFAGNDDRLTEASKADALNWLPDCMPTAPLPADVKQAAA